MACSLIFYMLCFLCTWLATPFFPALSLPWKSCLVMAVLLFITPIRVTNLHNVQKNYSTYLSLPSHYIPLFLGIFLTPDFSLKSSFSHKYFSKTHLSFLVSFSWYIFGKLSIIPWECHPFKSEISWYQETCFNVHITIIENKFIH